MVDLFDFETEVDGAQDGLHGIDVEEAVHKEVPLKQVNRCFHNLLPEQWVFTAAPTSDDLDEVAEVAFLQHPIVEVCTI